MKTDEKTLIKELFMKIVLPVIIIALASLALLYYNRKPIPGSIKPPIHDSTNAQLNINNEVIKVAFANNKMLRDSLFILLNRKPIYLRGKTRIKDSLIYVSDSICDTRLNQLYDISLVGDSINNSIITNQFKQLSNDSIIINRLQNKVVLKQMVRAYDSTMIVRLCDSIPKVKRKGYFKGLKHGVVISAVIVEGVNAGAKFIP